MKKLRIVHVNDIAYVGFNYVEALRALGHEADLICLRLPGALLPTSKKVFYLHARLRELIDINRQIARGNYDCVHIHYGYLGLLGILGRYPYYLHLHGSDIRDIEKDPLRRFQSRESVLRAKTCFYVSPDLATELNKYRPDGIFLPNPICTDRFRRYEEVQAENRKIRVLLISALSEIKGVDTAFQAVDILRQQGYSFEMAAFDIGSDKDRYLNRKDINFLPEIVYSDNPNMNAVHDFEMAKIINAFDIVIGQFRIGSLGLAELEAMSCEKPVVCYYADFGKYTENPPVLSGRDPQAVADLLGRLITDRAYRIALGMQSREWVKKYHDSKVIAEQLLDIYAAR
jgi:glycosyltransferase involved in cell wall biosynthesis